MPYVMKLGNILDSTDDAIINSLGTHTDRYGRLCKAIIEGSNSIELKNYIDNLGKVNILDTFTTSGYNLKCKKIIHIVTPFKKYDNDASQLEKAYDTLFNKAIEKGYKSISISFIGTGANGYSDVEASNAISKAVDKIISEEEKLDKVILKITLYIKPKTKEELLKEYHYIYRERRFDEPELVETQYKYKETPSFDPLEFKDKFIKMYGNKLNSGQLIKNSEKVMLAKLTCEYDPIHSKFPVDLLDKGVIINYPYDYVNNYINTHSDEWKKNKELKETQRLNNAGIDKKKRNKYRNKKSLNTKDLFSIAFAFNMTKEETIAFMIINGTSFSPLDKYSSFYLEYLNGLHGNLETFYKLNERADAFYGISFGEVEE